MEKRSKIWLVILLSVVGIAVSVCMCGGVLLCLLVEDVLEETLDFETSVDESKEYFAKCSSPPEFFGSNTGIVLPEGTKPVYMISSDGLFPPYRLEAHFVIPKSEIETFIQDNEFAADAQGFCEPSFLWLTDDLPPELRPTRTEGTPYTRNGGGNTEIPAWWTYMLNADTGDLWVQYNTE